jgi:hypothetical protein
MGKRKNKNRQNRQKSLAIQNSGEAAILPTPEFLTRHQIEKVKLDKDSYANRVISGRPIDKSHRLYCIDRDRGIGENYRRGINDDQFRAADRLANNHKRRFPQMTVPMDAIRVDSTINISMYPVESIMDAVNQHAKLMRQLSLLSQEIVEEICCNETSLMSYEHGKGWRKGYGVIRLREALDELIEAYRSTRNRKSAKNI